MDSGLTGTNIRAPGRCRTADSAEQSVRRILVVENLQLAHLREHIAANSRNS